MVLKKDDTKQNYWEDVLTVPIPLLRAMHKKWSFPLRASSVNVHLLKKSFMGNVFCEVVVPEVINNFIF